MMEPDQVKKIIAEGLPCEGLHVQGDGQHFEALIVCSLFEGKNRVKRQQLVNAVLKPYFDSGELHALSMSTITPAEWSAARG